MQPPQGLVKRSHSSTPASLTDSRAPQGPQGARLTTASVDVVTHASDIAPAFDSGPSYSARIDAPPPPLEM